MRKNKKNKNPFTPKHTTTSRLYTKPASARTWQPEFAFSKEMGPVILQALTAYPWL
jgi:hypothetical protein